MRKNEMTLFPVGVDAGLLPTFDETRVVVRFAGRVPVLRDDWQRVTLHDKREAWVRSADCGGGCRCAGEIAFTVRCGVRLPYASDPCPNVASAVAPGYGEPCCDECLDVLMEALR